MNQVLDLTIDEAREFFDRGRYPAIAKRLEPLAAVGLGYLQLGQTTSTLSGGEAQRLKLARFLLADLEPPQTSEEGQACARACSCSTSRPRGSRRRILSGCHAGGGAAGRRGKYAGRNRAQLSSSIAHADYVIDLGPGGGGEGGRLVVAGDPLAIAACEKSATGIELRRLFGLPMAGGPRAIKSALRTGSRRAMYEGIGEEIGESGRGTQNF